MPYALGLNPHHSLQSLLPQPDVVGGSVTLTFWAGAAGVSYNVQPSTNLDFWTSDGVEISEANAEGIRTASIHRDSLNRFLRLRVSTNR